MPSVNSIEVPDPAIDRPVPPSTNLVPTRATKVSEHRLTCVGSLAAWLLYGVSVKARITRLMLTLLSLFTMIFVVKIRKDGMVQK